MKYKKILAYVMIFVMMLGIVGCGKEEKEAEATTTEATTAEISPSLDMTEQAVQEATEEQPEKDIEGFYPVEDYVETIGDTINVRFEPSTDANIYVLLGPGEVLKRTGYNQEWSRVLIDGDTVYIFSDYVVETEAPEDAKEDDEEEVATSSDAQESVKKIVIDPGKQANANMVMEEIGPGSTDTKMGASDGFTGSILGTKESGLNLEYAVALKAELEGRGYEVLLTRESDNIDLSNKARAEYANTENADIFIRLQMNFSSNSELSGIMAITMTKQSPYNSDLYTSSNILATRLLQNVIAQTDATNHGIYETDEMTVINWSEAPVTIINIGYLSNEADEANLVNQQYKNKVITGIADGIDDYFE